MREKHKIAYTSNETTAINEETRSIRFVVSAEEVDRDYDIVTAQAMAEAIKSFADNPVCLACHQHRLADGMPPVVGSWNTETFKQSGKRSEMDLTFATTDLGETYWKLYKDRHMRAVSIGFRILDAQEEVRNQVRIHVITKIELFEISCVPVGSNRSALSKIKDLDMENDSQTFKAIENLKLEIEQLRSELVEQLDQIKDIIIPRGIEQEPPAAPENQPACEPKSGNVLHEIAKLFTNQI
ncbi:HK97 family phage prohead protease [Anaerohalosphaeraceae bacterium U12dextr]|jgi:HK97 family phage prohead protease